MESEPGGTLTTRGTQGPQLQLNGEARDLRSGRRDLLVPAGGL